jgi:hypothetical protein
MAGRYTGSYPDQCSGWRAVAALADIGQASLVGRIPKDKYTLIEVVSKSASEGEADMASEHLYVADVPGAAVSGRNSSTRSDVASQRIPTNDTGQPFSDGTPMRARADRLSVN